MCAWKPSVRIKDVKGCLRLYIERVKGTGVNVHLLP